MKTPPRLLNLLEEGFIDAIEATLKTGKEAEVYLVRVRGELCCAKVYKDAQHRSFRQAAIYQEGRRVRDSRRARAMNKHSRYGRHEQEEVWHSAEWLTLQALARAGVRVPRPRAFFEGVLLLDLVAGEDGGPAPRLHDVGTLTPEVAHILHAELLREVVRMLCAGYVHADLSEYNILLDASGPVIIDFPQAVDAAANAHAQSLLYRDVARLGEFLGRFAPDLRDLPYGEEIWALYQSGHLHPESELTGHVASEQRHVDLRGVMREIRSALAEEAARQRALRERELDD